MGGLASLLGDESRDVLTVQRGRVRRGEVVRDNDMVSAVAGEPLTRFSQQMPENPSGDILKVDGPFAEVRVVDRGECVDELVGDPLEDKFRIVLLAVDPVDHLVDEAGVLKNKEMGVENAGISGGWGAGKSLLKGDQLAARCKQSYLETRDFRIQFFLLKIAERNDFLFLEMDENLSLGDARCDPDA
jgi:hypothetical protein